MEIEDVKSMVLSVQGIKFLTNGKGRRNVDVLTFKDLRSNLKFDVNLHNEEKPFVQAVFLDLGFTKIDVEIKNDVNKSIAEFSSARFLQD